MSADEDGAHITFNKESPNRMAVAGLKSRNEFGQSGEKVARITEIKLRDPTIAIRAIDTLNRMEGVYEEEKGNQGVQVTLIIVKPSGEVQKIAGNASDPLPEIEPPVIEAPPFNLRYVVT